MANNSDRAAPKIENDSTNFHPAFEIVIVLLCGLAIEWLILPITRNPLVIAVPVVIAFATVVRSHYVRGETLAKVGWRFDNFGQCVKLLAVPTIVVILFLILIGWLTGGLRLEELIGWGWLKKYHLLLISAAIQQHVLQAFFNRRTREIWNADFVGVIVAAAIFALLHLPNLWLTVATFTGGLIWCFVYRRASNLFALTLSHALMSAILAATIPPAALHGLRVGYNYFRL